MEEKKNNEVWSVAMREASVYFSARESAMRIAFIALLGLVGCAAMPVPQKPDAPKTPAVKKSVKPECSEYGSMSESGGWCSACIVSCVDGKWGVDEKATKEMYASFAKMEDHRQKLYWALRSRVLTIDEMKEVQETGDRLLQPISPGLQPYDEVRNSKMFNDALAQQFRLQIIAKENLKCNDSTEAK